MTTLFSSLLHPPPPTPFTLLSSKEIIALKQQKEAVLSLAYNLPAHRAQEFKWLFKSCSQTQRISSQLSDSCPATGDKQ
jgi:hypothetical protein